MCSLVWLNNDNKNGVKVLPENVLPGTYRGELTLFLWRLLTSIRNKIRSVQSQ